jgi:hypothetical protein
MKLEKKKSIKKKEKKKSQLGWPATQVMRQWQANKKQVQCWRTCDSGNEINITS